MAEDKFEQAVIEKLKSEGWDYLSEYSGVTVDRLYDHWRDILNANNRARLEDNLLSDNEFEQIKLELTKNKTPYDAQLMLAGAGAGGVGTVPLNRDDGTQLELEIFYGDEVAGGRSRYEIVNQITFTDLATSLSSKRRIDILLLINGLPVAHIEEKDESLQNQWNAFEQFQKYDGNRVDIQFLHEPGNPSWTAPKLQWLKFQIQFMVDLHNTVSLLKFRKDPQNPLFQVRIFGPAF